MSYIPRLTHCYELWKDIRTKFEELNIDSDLYEDWLDETMNIHINQTKENVRWDIDNCLEVISMYDRKRLKP